MRSCSRKRPKRLQYMGDIPGGFKKTRGTTLCLELLATHFIMQHILGAKKYTVLYTRRSYLVHAQMCAHFNGVGHRTQIAKLFLVLIQMEKKKVNNVCLKCQVCFGLS